MAIKAKNIKVEIGPVPKKKTKGIIYFANFQDMNKVLNPNRVSILEAIKQKNPESIYKLAELVNRDQGNVTKDVNILKEHGFVELAKNKEGERVRSQPKVDSEVIEMVIKLGAGTLGLAKEVLENVTSEFKDKNLEKNKKYAKDKYENIAKSLKKPLKDTVKKVAKEFDIVVKDR